MADLKYTPVPHDHAAFLAKARERAGFAEAYEALALEYALASEMLAARSQAELTQDAVAQRMGTTKSAISRLEAAGRHAPSLATQALCRCGGLRVAGETGAAEARLMPRQAVAGGSDAGSAEFQANTGNTQRKKVVFSY